ncbi:heavy metal-associated domain-containing protein [Cryobacterium sp. CG_9.6]|uniref:heavy-metal-associated domain-containing protein n=1 Tax=Cryobacterium sp. CG_9.6 TaxID=2760710 RepID=UPI0024766378|nr:heavy metal-associated domain-containing protein [Cryobacterium sp. CG_9.6]MDH6238607.1 copper chaperone CopZ [Cryobacterium sp. CG_9.6]
METTVNISGMTCAHCVGSVTEELTAIEGVENVDVELNAGGVSRATITSNTEINPEQISEAVADAGYLAVADS